MLGFRFAALAALAALASAGTVRAAACGPYVDPHTAVTEVGPGVNLASVVNNAAAGTTILLRPGTYKVSTMIQFNRANVTLRSKTGNRADVILDGNMGAASPLDRTKFLGEIILVRASGVVLADITIRHARYHGVHVAPPPGIWINGFLMHNVRVHDCSQQQVKVNSSGGTSTTWADNGTIRCGVIEFTNTALMYPMGSDFYTGGIDVHGGSGWKVHNNVFRNFHRNARVIEPAVHFWSKSRHTVVENNLFENNYRAIGFGMKTAQSGPVRTYSDGKGNSPYYDHMDGVIRNNTIWNGSGVYMDAGISLWNVHNEQIHHNTIYTVNAPFSGIEYRFPNTRVSIRNNLLGKNILARDGAQATLAANLQNVPASTFASAATGNLHLAAGTLSTIVDRAVVLTTGVAGVDMDEQARGSLPDIGADERMTALGKAGGGVETSGRALAPAYEVPAGVVVRDPSGRRVRATASGYRARGLRIVE